MAAEQMQPGTTSLERRSFLKWAGALGGAAALSGTSLLTGCKSELSNTGESAEAASIGNSQAALSDGLPYGADKIVPTICTCGDACGPNHVGQAYVKDGNVVYYEGCPDAPNKGRLCARGMAGMSIINNPNRIKYPMRRTNEKGVEGEFERISWDEAYDTIVEALAKAIEEEGPHTIANVVYHHGNMMLYGFCKAFAKIWSTDSTYAPGGCFSDLQIGEAATLGDSYHWLQGDPQQSKVILSWGENDAVAKPSEYGFALREAQVEHGAYWIQVEPRVSVTTEKSDLYLPVRPGADAYLALAMCNVIIEEGLEDKQFIADHTFGYEEFKELVKKYDPETVEKITWCPADRIREAARIYATNKPGMILIGRGGNQTGGRSNAGWLMSRAIECLIGLTGNAGMKGAGLSTETSIQPTNGLWFNWPVDVMPTGQAASVDALIERDPNYPEGGVWGSAERLVEREPWGYRIWMGNINPAGSAGNTEVIDEALKKLDLVVVNNRLNHWTGSGYADILIPICTWPEMYVTSVDYEEMLMTEPAIDPMFESVSDFEYYKQLSRRLAKRLGLDEQKAWPWETDLDWMEWYVHGKDNMVDAEIKKRIDQGYDKFKEWENITVEKVIASHHGFPNPFYSGLDDYVPYLAKHYPHAPEGTDPESVFFPTYPGGEYTGDGRLLFRCDWLSERSGGKLPAMPVPEEPYDSWYADGNPIESGNWEESEAVKAGYNLVACGKAHTHWGFLSFNQDKDGGPASMQLREAFLTADRPCVEINPRDARERGLSDGDAVTVESQEGKMENLTLVVSERAMPGVIVPPCHWGKNQCAIYPYSQSLRQLTQEERLGLNPRAVGEWAGKPGGIGGQNVQSAVLCKVYKYEG